MKKHRGSDYALNKYSMGNVYRFEDRIIEVPLEDYLQENSDKTEQIFRNEKFYPTKCILNRYVWKQHRGTSRFHLTDWKKQKLVLCLLSKAAPFCPVLYHRHHASFWIRVGRAWRTA